MMIKRLTAILTVASVLLLPTAVLADDNIVPSNDNFESATVIAELPFSDSFASRLATPELFEPDCARSQTAWYSYTPAEDVNVIADSLGSWAGYYSIGVYTGGPRFRDLTRVACDNYYQEARVALKLDAGKTYYFQIGTDYIDGNDGMTQFNLSLPGSIQGMVTDQFGSPIEGVHVYAEMDPYTWHSGFDGRGRTDAAGFYSITGLSAGAYRLRFSSPSWDYFSETYDERSDYYGSDYDVVHVGAGQTVTVDEDLTLGGKITGTVYDDAGGPVSRICVRVVDASEKYIASASTGADGRYTIRRLTTGQYRLLFLDCNSVDRFSSEWYNDQLRFADADVVAITTGDVISNIDASLSPASAPVNDLMTDATEVTELPYVATPTTYLATAQVGEPRCNPDAPNTIWYKLTSDRAQLVSIDASSVESAHSIGVYESTGLDTESGDLNFNTLACERPSGSWSATAFDAEANRIYWIQLEGYGARVELSILREEIPANDNLADAVDIGELPATHLARTHAATMEVGEPISCGSTVHGIDHGHSVWYKLTASPDQSEIDVDTFGSGFDTVIAIYRASGTASGLQAADLQEMACSNDVYPTRQSRLSFTPVAGTTYFIQATGYQADSGPLRLNVRYK